MVFKWKDASSLMVINLSVMIFVRSRALRQCSANIRRTYLTRAGTRSVDSYALTLNVFIQVFLSFLTLSFNSDVDTNLTQCMANSQIYPSGHISFLHNPRSPQLSGIPGSPVHVLGIQLFIFVVSVGSIARTQTCAIYGNVGKGQNWWPNAQEVPEFVQPRSIRLK